MVRTRRTANRNERDIINEAAKTEAGPGKKLLALTALGIVALVAAAPAEGKTHHSRYITSPVGWCMIADAGGVGCNGNVLPGVTDGYLRLARKGNPVLGDTGGPITKKRLGNTSARLRRGDRWNKRGVRCRYIRGGIKCSNGRHGFKLKKRGYRVW